MMYQFVNLIIFIFRNSSRSKFDGQESRGYFWYKLWKWRWIVGSRL